MARGRGSCALSMPGLQSSLAVSEFLYAARALAWIAAFAYSLSPFDFSSTAASAGSGITWAEPLDATLLLGLFVHALAFATVGFLHRLADRVRRPTGSLTRGLVPGVLGCAVIEIGQLFIPERHPEAIDLVVNCLGMAVGHMVAASRYIPPLLACLPGAAASRRWSLLVSGIAWSATLLAPAYLVRLNMWDPSYPLVLGNETDGGRAWQGEIRYVGFYDRAIEVEQARQALDASPDSPSGRADRLRLGLIAGFDFSEPRRVSLGPFASLPLPTLRLMLPASSRWVEDTPSSIVMGDDRPVTTAASVTELTDKLATRDDFSLEVWFRSRTPDQTGPARIVSISNGPYRRNLMLGQEGNALHFRVRNGLNGDNGTRFQLICSGVVSGRLQRVVATYDNGLSRIDGLDREACSINVAEPSVLLHLGAGPAGHVAVAALAALSLILVASFAGSPKGLLGLLCVGYGWLAATMAASLMITPRPATSLAIWMAPAIVASFLVTRSRTTA